MGCEMCGKELYRRRFEDEAQNFTEEFLGTDEAGNVNLISYLSDEEE